MTSPKRDWPVYLILVLCAALLYLNAGRSVTAVPSIDAGSIESTRPTDSSVSTDLGERRDVEFGVGTARGAGGEIDASFEESAGSPPGTRPFVEQERQQVSWSVENSIAQSERRIREFRLRSSPDDLRAQYQQVREELREQRDLELMRLAQEELRRGGGYMLQQRITPESVAGGRRFYFVSWHGPESDVAGALVVIPDMGTSVPILEAQIREALRGEAALDARDFNLKGYVERRSAVDEFAKSGGAPIHLGIRHEILNVLDVDSIAALLRLKP